MDNTDFIVDLIRMSLALLIVVGLMYGLSYFLRRMDRTRLGKTEHDHTHITPIRALDSRRRLVEVHWRGQDVLLLLGANEDIVVARSTKHDNTDSHDTDA